MFYDFPNKKFWMIIYRLNCKTVPLENIPMPQILNRFYSKQFVDIFQIDATPALPNALSSQLCHNKFSK